MCSVIHIPSLYFFSLLIITFEKKKIFVYRKSEKKKCIVVVKNCELCSEKDGFIDCSCIKKIRFVDRSSALAVRKKGVMYRSCEKGEVYET